MQFLEMAWGVAWRGAVYGWLLLLRRCTALRCFKLQRFTRRGSCSSRAPPSSVGSTLCGMLEPFFKVLQHASTCWFQELKGQVKGIQLELRELDQYDEYVPCLPPELSHTKDPPTNVEAPSCIACSCLL